MVTERTRLRGADLADDQSLVWNLDPAPKVTQQHGREQKRQDATLLPGCLHAYSKNGLVQIPIDLDSHT